MRFLHPAIAAENYFPGSKSDVSLFVETVLFDKDAKQYQLQPGDSTEIKWEHLFLCGTLYQKNIVEQNWGFSDQDLLSCFIQHQKEFDPKGDGLQFAVVREKVAEKLFVEKTPPDSAFCARFSNATPSFLNKAWLSYIKQEQVEYFSNLLYIAKYHKPFPSAAKDLMAQTNLFAQSDIDTVINWLGSGLAAKRGDPVFRASIARKMVSWKLFADEAQNCGFASTKFFRHILGWNDRYEPVRRFENRLIAGKAPHEMALDSLALELQWMDSSSGETPMPASLYADELSRRIRERDNAISDSIVFARRSAAPVRFLQSLTIDDLDRGPERAMQIADSLRRVNDLAAAPVEYEKAARDYGWSKQVALAHLRAAQVYMDMDRTDKATIMFRRFLETCPIDSLNAEACFSLG